LNRIDDIILFDILSKESIEEIVKIQVEIVAERLKAKDIILAVSEEVLAFLAKEGYNPQYGARPLKRLIQNKILTPVASLMISQGVVKGGAISVGLKGEEFIFDVKKKKKWETVIKKWVNTVLKQNDKDHEQWARVNRRFVGIASSMSNMFLPSEMEIEEMEEEKKKIKVVFFQDTSGSCSHLAERFFKAAKSLDPKKFDVELYCFDTRCYKTSLESGRLYGFGGTSFSILEQEVVELCKGDMSKYPKAVFVITDGYGDPVHPRKPKNWYWFLSCDYRHCIPDTCNVFKLSEFE
jgi:hypothetical protein